MSPSPVSPARIWLSMTLVSGQAADVRVMVMTAVRSWTATARTKPEIDDVHAQVGIDDFGQGVADANGSGSLVGRCPRGRLGRRRADAGGSPGSAPVGRDARCWPLACSPAGRRTTRTRQVGLWIQSAAP